MNKKLTKKILKYVKIMTTQLVIYQVFFYFKENYILIAIDLSKQTKLKDLQQISFIGKLEGQDNGATMFFIIEK